MDLPETTELTRALTRALRERSPELVRAAVMHALDKRVGDRDYRDLLMGLAPAHDCLCRMGVDPVAFFDELAADAPDYTVFSYQGPQPVADTLRKFGRRTDTAPESFGGFGVVETAEGPEYRWTR